MISACLTARPQRAWPVHFTNLHARGINPIGDDQGDVPAHWSVTFSTDDADQLAARAAEMDGSVQLPPMDVPWARMTMIADPQGASFVATRMAPENRG